MTRQKELLEKYFKGESTLEEEKELRALQGEESLTEAEADIFGYFEKEAEVPDGLEEELMAGIDKRTGRRAKIRKLVSWTSAAAAVLIVFSVYLDVRKQRNLRIEDNFFVMEQALYQVSESIQPQEQQQMLVLWVDENTEIIIN